MNPADESLSLIWLAQRVPLVSLAAARAFSLQLQMLKKKKKIQQLILIIEGGDWWRFCDSRHLLCIEWLWSFSNSSYCEGVMFHSDCCMSIISCLELLLWTICCFENMIVSAQRCFSVLNINFCCLEMVSKLGPVWKLRLIHCILLISEKRDQMTLKHLKFLGTSFALCFKCQPL